MPRQHLTSIVLASLVFASGTAAATGAIYKWVDQNGVTQYSQTPPPKNAKNKQTVRVSTHVPVDVREGRAQGMVDAQTLQTYTSTAPNTATAAQPNRPDTEPDPVEASTRQGSDAPTNNAVPLPIQSSTVPSAPVPLTSTKPEEY